MQNHQLPQVPILSRIGFAYAAALAGWTVAWCLTIAYFTILPLLHHYRPIRGADQWGMFLIYLICTLAFMLVATTIFGVPYVAIRSTDSMLRHPWRFYVATTIVGAAAITCFIVRPVTSADHLHQALKDSIAYNIFSLVATTATSFVFLRWLRRRQQIAISNQT